MNIKKSKLSTPFGSDQLLISISLKQNQYEQRIEPWTWEEQKDGDLSLDFQLSNDSSMAIKFSDFVKAEASANSTVAAVLEGKSGRRLKLKKPVKFLRDEVIAQEGAQEWIRTQASISFKAKFGRPKFKAPEIWMVTGVQLVTEGNVKVGSSKSISTTVGGSGDPGAAFGAPPGTTAIGAEVSHGRESEANTGYSHKDERVWAAQFMEIKIDFGTEADKDLKSKENKPLPAAISTFKLEDIADLKARGIRATQQQRADANGQPFQKSPELVGRIVIGNANDEDDDSSDSGDIQIGEDSYVGGLDLDDADWEMYDECSNYLRDE